MLALSLLFLLMVILIRFKVPIGLSLIAGAIFLGIFHFGIGRDFWNLIYQSLINLKSWKLVVTVALILTFARVFEKEHFVESMVTSLRSFFPPSWVSKAAPAIIGLLPMPGGAMVSAPVVKEIGRDSEISPEDLTASNYWWRHVWETAWPLYPSIILAAAVLKVSVWQVSLINFPVSIMCIVSGFFLKSIGSSKRPSENPRWALLLNSLWPLIAIVVLGLALRIDLIISVIFVLILMFLTRKIKISVLFDGIKHGFSLEIVALIFGVMTLMYSIEITGTASVFYHELLALNVPAEAVVFVVPFVVGLLTGITSAYIGVGFPIVLPLIGTSLSNQAGMLLAFSGGFMGIMASPMHLCLVLTKDYFGASLFRSIFRLVLPIFFTSIMAFFLAYTFYH